MISTRTHSIINYLIVVFLILSPSLFDFNESASIAIYIIAVYSGIISLAADVFSAISIAVHRILELICIAAMLCLGIFFNSEPQGAGTFFFAIAMAQLMVSMLTDFRSVERRSDHPSGHERTKSHA